MSDEYSDETYAAWTRFADAVRDRSRDWLRLGQPVNQLQVLADQHARMRNMSALQAAQAMLYRPQAPYYGSTLGGLFGGLI